MLLFLVSGTLSQDGFDLADALDDLLPPTTKPKVDPALPDPDAKKPDENPKSRGGGTEGFDLNDAFGPDEEPKKPDNTPKSGGGGGGGDGGFDLFDALGPDEPKPDKPAVNPNRGGGGGTLDDSALFDLAGDGGNYEPDGGRPAGGGGGRDPGYDPRGHDDQPQGEAGSGQIAGIVSAVGVALMGAASSYIAYQKKKLCFKIQGGVDPEKGQRGTHTEPQVLSNLLQSN